MELVDRVSTALSSKKGSAWITGSPPWSEMFRQTVKSHLEEINSSMNIESVDILDYMDDLSIENLIFMFDESARRNYLPAIDLQNTFMAGKSCEKP